LKNASVYIDSRPLVPPRGSRLPPGPPRLARAGAWSASTVVRDGWSHADGPGSRGRSGIFFPVRGTWLHATEESL
jgi:hypothetical protein